jgi:hypothetical protein
MALNFEDNGQNTWSMFISASYALFHFGQENASLLRILNIQYFMIFLERRNIVICKHGKGVLNISFVENTNHQSTICSILRKRSCSFFPLKNE